MKSVILNILFLLSLNHSFAQNKQNQPNVLFIMVDDLRPQLGCYGDKVVKSPNIDELAKQGTLFMKAYCQMALCGPSRASLLTGQYPEKTKVFNVQTDFRTALPNVVTLPQFFKQKGYQTTGLYKVFHLVGFEPQIFGDLDDSASWTIPHWVPARSAWGPEGEAIYQKSKAEATKKGPLGYENIPRSLAYEAPDVADSMLSDGETALKAIERLQKLKDKPFFLAVGFYKPHLPFVAPKKYWDLYDEDQLKLPDNIYPPVNAPAYAAGGGNSEIRSYTNMPKTGPIEEKLGKKLLHGYLASISYTDAQVGLVLKELDRLGLRENTIVVLLGDHGYQIGEHGLWGKKHTNYDKATHAPLIVSAPGYKKATEVQSFVEFVDIYPSLLELTGFKPTADLAGKSFVPLMKNPSLKGRDRAFSMYPKAGRSGRTICTERYRLVEWKAKNGSVDYELYDHKTDPGENNNLAVESKYGPLIKSLQILLDKAGK